ncbi:N-6 DNA methylase [Clostridium butyricum]
MVDIEKIIIDKLWKGLNVLRGYLDFSVAQRLFRELLFIKLLNDELKKGNKYFTDRINGTLNFDRYIDDIEIFFNELHFFNESNEFLNGLIVEIFRLQESNDYKMLRDLLDLLNSIENTIEIKPSVVYKYFLDLTFKNSKGEITTSQSINKLVSLLLEEREMESIYDPAIGTGILTLEVANQHENIRVYGQDINRDVLSICKMLLILDERIEDISNIIEGNTIVNPGNVQGDELKKFDCSVCNPPFGLKDWGYNEVANYDKYNRFHRGLPSKSLADYAFISHVVESLNDKGIAIMVETTGVLFKEGAEGIIREKLVDENIIDCIIALPNNMMHGTAIPVNLMVFNKNKKTDDILLIDISREVEGNKILTTISSETINKVVNIYKERLQIDGLSRIVNKTEIKQNSFNLNVPRYIEVNVEKEKLDIQSIGSDIKGLIMKLQDIQNKLKKF